MQIIYVGWKLLNNYFFERRRYGLEQGSNLQKQIGAHREGQGIRQLGAADNTHCGVPVHDCRAHLLRPAAELPYRRGDGGDGHGLLLARGGDVDDPDRQQDRHGSDKNQKSAADSCGQLCSRLRRDGRRA